MGTIANHRTLSPIPYTLNPYKPPFSKIVFNFGTHQKVNFYSKKKKYFVCFSQIEGGILEQAFLPFCPTLYAVFRVRCSRLPTVVSNILKCLSLNEISQTITHQACDNSIYPHRFEEQKVCILHDKVLSHGLIGSKKGVNERVLSFY